MFYIRPLLFSVSQSFRLPFAASIMVMSDILTKCVLFKIFYEIVYLKVEKEIHNVNLGTVSKANRQSLGGSIFIHL